MPNSRRKGKAGERAFARGMFDVLGVRLVRNLQQARAGGCDLIIENPDHPLAARLDRFAIEVKRSARASPFQLRRWWQQAIEQARRCSRIPVLAYREDRREWRVMLPLGVIARTEPDPVHTATVDMDGFAEIVKLQPE